jgi:predicted TIM-barrel fold metal-dependent hydrolase
MMMAPAQRLLSADDHVQEPDDLWTARLSPAKFGDRIPRVARHPDGTDRWVVEGRVRNDLPLARTAALAPDHLTDPRTLAEIPAAAVDPEARLQSMDADGVAAAVLYPTAAGLGGEVVGAIADPALELECVRAYNDWLLESWAAASPRFVPQCLIPIGSVEAAIAEATRAVGRGHRGVVMPSAPWLINADAPHLYEPPWNPFWSCVRELGVPVCFHSGSAPSLMLDIYEGFAPEVAKGFDMVRRPSSSGMVVCRFLFSGIGERHPELKVVFSATGIDWMPFMLEVADHERERICRKGELPLEMDTPPSTIFHRQCHVTTTFDRVGLRLASFIGVVNILFGSEFPLDCSNYPQTAAAIDRNFAGVPESDRRRILWENAAELYGVEA